MRLLKNTLEELRYEKEVSDMKAGRVVELEELVKDLKLANCSLEASMSQLCESPFAKATHGKKSSTNSELLGEQLDLKNKLEHLQEAVKTNHNALVSMTEQASILREAKEASERAAEELKLKCQELETIVSILKDKMMLYSSDDDINAEDLERALTAVKRQRETGEKVEFLESVDPAFAVKDSLPAIRKKLLDVQVINLSLTKENERLDSMLRLQSTINKDLCGEVEILTRRMNSEKRDSSLKIKEVETISTRRREKIKLLEAQVRQFLYNVSRTPTQAVDGEHSAIAGTSNDLLTELFAGRGSIAPDENLVEIWVKTGAIPDKFLVDGSLTFVVIDFLDFESQTTSLLPGSNPQWNFAAKYRIKVDDFLLRYFATDCITFELNIVSVCW